MAEAEDVTPTAAASALGDGLGSALLVAGVDKWPKRDSWPLYPLFSDERVAGRRYRRAGTSPLRKGKAKLFAGAGGVTVVTASSEAGTVTFNDCEVLEQRP